MKLANDDRNHGNLQSRHGFQAVLAIDILKMALHNNNNDIIKAPSYQLRSCRAGLDVVYLFGFLKTIAYKYIASIFSTSLVFSSLIVHNDCNYILDRKFASVW